MCRKNAPPLGLTLPIRSGSMRWLGRILYDAFPERRRAATKPIQIILLVLGILLAACGGQEDGSPAAQPPRGAIPSNLLLISIDTLRADHVGIYGDEDAETPTLDQLAREGVRFETAMAPAPLTLPSHATLLTGLHPPHHGVRHNGIFRLEGSFTTLAEHLKENGFETAGVVAALVLGPDTGLSQGFDFYDGELSGKQSNARGYVERSASEVTDKALSWAQHNQSGRFFLWVHYYDPHSTYRPPKPYRLRFPGRLYDGEVAYVDAEIKRLLDGLRLRKKLEETLVVVTSDHGESLEEHHEATHSYTLYDATLRVPLILRGMGVPRGQVVGGVVGLVDVMPTVLSLLSVVPMEDLDGEDLGVYWRSKGVQPSGAAYSESLATRLDWGWSPVYSMRSDRYHFVRAPRPEIYDVKEDPHQVVNRFEVDVPEIRSNALALDRQIQEILDTQDLDHTAEVDGDILEQLRALGYAIPDVPPVETGEDPKDGLLHARELVEIEKAFSSADWKRAESLIQDHLTRAPGDARARLLLAGVYLYTRRWDEALKSSELSVLLAPWSVNPHLVRAEILIAVGRMKEAVASLERAHNIEPTAGVVRANGMFEAFHAGDSARAFAIARSTQNDFGYDSGVHQKIGDAFKRYGEYDEARKAYLRSVEEGPANRLSQMLLAIEWARAGHAENAAGAREESLRYGQDPWLSLDLAMGFKEAGLTDAAQTVLEEILVMDPGFAPAVKRLEELREPG